MNDIQVNGATIASAEIEAEMAYHPLLHPAERRQAAARALVVRRLLLDEAARTGVTGGETLSPEEEEKAIALLLENAIRIPEPAEKEISRWHKANRADPDGCGELTAETRRDIADFLQETAWKRRLQDYLARLGAKADIRNFNLFAGVSVQISQTKGCGPNACPSPQPSPFPPAA